MTPNRFTNHQLETMIPLCRYPIPQGTNPETRHWRELACRLVAELDETRAVARDLLVFAQDAKHRKKHSSWVDGTGVPDRAIERAENLHLR